jgi:prepilin-type N-terminal cleavage/methylation domain-containing protein
MRQAQEAGRRGSERGVTLTELLVVLAIIGFLVMVTVPAFAEWLRAYKVRTAAHQIQGDLRLARNVAVAKNADVPVLFKLDRFSWTDGQGRMREFLMPPNVAITNLVDPSAGDTITMKNNGQVSNPGKTLTVDTWVRDTLHHVWTVSFTASGKVIAVRTSP